MSVPRCFHMIIRIVSIDQSFVLLLGSPPLHFTSCFGPLSTHRMARPMRPDRATYLPPCPSVSAPGPLGSDAAAASSPGERGTDGRTGRGTGGPRRVMRWSQPTAANIFFSVSSGRRVVLVPDRSD